MALNWLKLKRPAQAANTSQDQAEVTNTAQPKIREILRRAPRFGTSPLQGVIARINGHGDTTPLLNVSTTGIGFPRTALQASIGDTIQGALELGEDSFEFTARVVHASGEVVGCAFVEANPRLTETLLRWFDSELAALSLTEVNASVLKAEVDGLPRFFFGSGHELYFVENRASALDGTHIIRFHVLLQGNYFEASEGRPLRYGHAISGDDGGGAYKSSSLVRFSDQVPETMVRSLIRFISSIPGLDPIHRDQLLAMVGK